VGDFKAIKMKPIDNVATVVEELRPNDKVSLEGDKIAIVVSEKIPFGHKFAVQDIAQGETIRKYGESIGVATQNIKTGQHVHVHNLESGRGRGDKH
jgi:altronate dehydratase small subunit